MKCSKAIEEIGEKFDSEDIQTGYFRNKKYNDKITLPRKCKRASIYVILPSYNTGTTMEVNYSAGEIAENGDQVSIAAYDVVTRKPSTSTKLAGYYIVVPKG